jgi:hypothetical protein
VSNGKMHICEKVIHIWMLEIEIMKKLLLLFLILAFFTSLAQEKKLNKVTIGFYPSFYPASTLTISFKKSEVIFTIDENTQTKKFKISSEDNNKLKSVVNNLLNNTQPPIDTLKLNDGKIILLDGRMSEDGMTTYIYLNGKKDHVIQFGNSYSLSEAELLTKLTILIRNRTTSEEYVNMLENYLN